MKKGCVYCEYMHLNKCPDAFSDVSKYCGNFNHEEMPQVSIPKFCDKGEL